MVRGGVRSNQEVISAIHLGRFVVFRVEDRKLLFSHSPNYMTLNVSYQDSDPYIYRLVNVNNELYRQRLKCF